MSKTLNIIGFGAVGSAIRKTLGKVIEDQKLPEIGAVHYYAPEIEDGVDGIFTYKKIPFINRDNLQSILDSFELKEGDIVMELATRICTHTIWKEVKRRGAHFVNSGFDVWPDVTLDLAALEILQADPEYSKSSGRTSLFSFGCNPGLASHFVPAGLKAATGIDDIKEAANAFGLRAVSFNERDTQWPLKKSNGFRKLTSSEKDSQTRTLYNTWSPGNYIVETAESTILYAGCSPDVESTSSAGPSVVGWVPSGPNIGFLAPHDETFTIQNWFDREIPAVFVYEAPPTARAYIKGGSQEHSSVATTKLLTPKAYDLAPGGYDQLGALLFSDKEGVSPFWCGITMNVADALAIDPTGSVGPTAFQVTGGLWVALQFILRNPDAGDCFSEEVPTNFVIENAFPWAGRLETRSAPEALLIPGLFDPAGSDAYTKIAHGEPVLSSLVEAAKARLAENPDSEFKEIRDSGAEEAESSVHGRGLRATRDLPAQTAIDQLRFVPFSLVNALGASRVNHRCGTSANAYVDRNRAVRTLRPVKEGEEITVDYSLLLVSEDEVVEANAEVEGLAFNECAGKCEGCRGTLLPASQLDKEYIKSIIQSVPIWGDEDLANLVN